jgi:hypothetical protein
MKANEAPERLYLSKNIYSTYLYQVPDPDDETAVEYTRTDAFIEKAKKWFIEHTNISQEIETNEDGEPLADSYIKYAKARLDAANEMFENFKKYMKEE